MKVAFATNDDRTAKRISDELGTVTELQTQITMPGIAWCRRWPTSGFEEYAYKAMFAVPGPCDRNRAGE